MFSRDAKHYRPTPRSLHESKWGPYTEWTEKRSRVGEWLYLGASLLCAATIGLILGYGV